MKQSCSFISQRRALTWNANTKSHLGEQDTIFTELRTAAFAFSHIPIADWSVRFLFVTKCMSVIDCYCLYGFLSPLVSFYIFLLPAEFQALTFIWQQCSEQRKLYMTVASIGSWKGWSHEGGSKIFIPFNATIFSIVMQELSIPFTFFFIPVLSNLAIKTVKLRLGTSEVRVYSMEVWL